MSDRISGESFFPRATSLIPITILMGVRSSWDTLDKKTAFCFSADSSSENTRSYHFRCAFRRLIQYMASTTPPRVTKTPRPRRNTSRFSISREMVWRTRPWYSSVSAYKNASIYKIHFLFSINSARIKMQATAGTSKRLDSCTPKKKNSVSISLAHRFS